MLCFGRKTLTDHFLKRIDMGFVVKNLTEQDFDFIYSLLEKENIAGLTRGRWEWTAPEIGRERWAVDRDSGAFLWGFPLHRDSAHFRYLFGMEGGAVIIKSEGYCLFSVEYVSENLKNRSADFMKLTRDAFKVSGKFIDGTSDEKDISAVPDARFTSMEGGAE